MEGMKLCVISFLLIHTFLHKCNCLTCETPNGPCKCATDEGDIDISSLDGSGTAAYVTKSTQTFCDCIPVDNCNLKIIPLFKFTDLFYVKWDFS